MTTQNITLITLRDRLIRLIEELPNVGGQVVTLVLEPDLGVDLITGRQDLAVTVLGGLSLPVAENTRAGHLLAHDPADSTGASAWAKRWGLSADQEAGAAKIGDRLHRIKFLRGLSSRLLSLQDTIAAHDERFGQ